MSISKWLSGLFNKPKPPQNNTRRYRYNKNTFCGVCNKLIYMGYTCYHDDMHCLCNRMGSDIPTYVDNNRLQTLTKEVANEKLKINLN